MKPRLLKSRYPLVVASLLAFAACGLPGQAREEERNPFGPVVSAGPAGPTNSPLDALELRGVMSIGDVTRVTLFDTTNSKSYTVELNETTNNWRVSGYNTTDDTVVVESGGASRKITLRKPKILAATAAPPAPIPVPGQPPPFVPIVQPPGQPPIAMPANAGTPVPQISDEDTRKRMETVAAEIQRRRQMRREQIERAPAAGQPQPQPQPAQQQ